MNIVFLIYHGFSENSGISKKIHSQIDALRKLGHRVNVCIYTINEKGERIRLMNETVITNYGTGRWAAFRSKIDYDAVYRYALEHDVDLFYVRSYHNANPFTIRLFRRLKKANIKIAMEIPTYPYDLEYVGFPWKTRLGLYIDRMFRKQLASCTEAIITYSDYKEIFGKRTIQISNGVDFGAISLISSPHRLSDEIHLIGVAEIHYWHGYDRLIHGLGEYYQNSYPIPVYFHIVGGIGPSEMYNSRHAPGFHELITQYHIEKYVIFHGQKMGEELDQLFSLSDFAIGSLGRHRSNINKIKTLKNREYAARGIPFIYSESDDDFDTMPYILKAPADESALDILRIVNFLKHTTIQPVEIRQSISHLSWKEQMNQVLKELEL